MRTVFSPKASLGKHNKADVQDIYPKTHISYAKAMATYKSVICELEIYSLF